MGRDIFGCQSVQWNDLAGFTSCWVRIPVGRIPHEIEGQVSFDSIGFHRGLRFPPTLHYKSPSIVYRANNFQIDAWHLIQYF
jgi:hypothetical protein